MVLPEILRYAQNDMWINENKKATEISVAEIWGRQTSRAVSRSVHSEWTRPLNENATDMGASVAVLTPNQRIWLNCYAETRPYISSLTSTDRLLNIQRVSFL
jgi:hypothetical protein